MVYQNGTAAPREELTDVIMEGVTDFGEFVGLALLPPLPMSKPTGHVAKITIAKGDMLRATTRERAPGSKFSRWQSAIDDHSMTLVQVGEEVPLPDEQTLLYEDYFGFEQVYAMEAGNRLKRGHEIDCEGAVFNTNNFDATNSAVAYTAANLAAMTPVADILAAIRLIKGRGEKANTISFPGTVWDRVRLSADMKSFIAGSINPGAIVCENTLAAALKSHGIEQVFVADSYVNQSQSTKNNSINLIWPVTYVFVGSCRTGALRSGGIGRSFYWEPEGPLFNVQSYRDESVKSNIVRGLKTTLTDITNTRAGTLITTQYT